MKSRKNDDRSAFRSRRKYLKRSLPKRAHLIEKLEKRELLTADFNSATKAILAKMRFNSPAAYEAAGTIIQSRLAAAPRTTQTPGGEGIDVGEGLSGTPFNTTELEPNNILATATFLPLGTTAGKTDTVNVNGIASSVNDADYFAFDLRKGDIFDFRLQAGVTTAVAVSFIDSAGTNLITANAPTNIPLPVTSPVSRSPLFKDGKTSFSYVIDRDGRYYVRVGGDLTGSYNLNLRTHRPTIENDVVGSSQTIFLDFDGDFFTPSVVQLDTAIGNNTPLAIPNITSILPQLGLTAADVPQLVNQTVQVVEAKLKTLVAVSANNGLFDQSGVPGEFNVIIKTTLDSPDISGQTNVTRVVIGGTSTLVNVPGLLGIAQSIDIGNFDREESVLVLTDIMVTDALALQRSGNSTVLQVFAELLADTIVHEVGHTFGAIHQDPNNAVTRIMDAGYVAAVSAGSGLDGIFGTADDVRLAFGPDGYDPTYPGIVPGTGINNSDNILAFGLSTGTIGGLVSGTNFNDINRNGQRDSGEPGLSGWTIFADFNNNGVRDSGETTARTNNDGFFTLRVAPGSFPVRAMRPSGWLATAPSSGATQVAVALNQTVGNVNFGSFLSGNQSVTGVKWNDLNANGIREAGEPLLEGVWMYIDLDGDGRIDLGEPSTKTRADGSYVLIFPGPGTYTVREVAVPGFVATFPAGGSYTVNYNGTTAPTGLDFGNASAVDYGDAPSPYPTLKSANGAGHGVFPGLALGSRIDAESDGRPSTGATGDDTNGASDGSGGTLDDEDGLSLPRPIVRGNNANPIVVGVTNSTGQTAFLQGWIDFNGDGDWDDAGEHIINNLAVASGSGLQNLNLTITAPTTAKLGTAYARFRLSQEQNVGPAGFTQTGEVEDHLFTIDETLTLAVDDAYTVSRNATNVQLNVQDNDFKIANDPSRIVSVTQGSQGGTIAIGANGAFVTYTPKTGFVGRETFTYTVSTNSGSQDTGMVTIDVILAFENPIAVDDSFDVQTDVIGFPLNVLANDLEGMNGALTIQSFTNPDKGGTVVIGTGNQSLRYTPARGFAGTERFTYTVVDNAGVQSTASVTVHTLPGDQVDDLAEISFRITNLSGEPVTAIQQGQQFKVGVYIDDLRSPETFQVTPGVYAAYLDLLYNAFLVSPAPKTPTAQSPFDFDVTFAPPYQSGRQGNADTPGIINDLGAFAGSSEVDSSDPVLLAELIFEARSPGLAEFVGDPADSSPFTDVLLYNTPNTPVPIEQVRYRRASLEIVGTGSDLPVAVDDSLTAALAAGSVSNVINVLANDVRGSTNSVRIVNVSPAINGSAAVDNRGTSDPLDDVILYTPNSGFNGTDQFTYTIQDSRGFTSTAEVTVQVGNAASDDDVRLRLEVTDINGSPISQIEIGQKFQLRGYVQDLRGSAVNPGVFAAFQDIIFDATKVSPDAKTGGLGFQVAFGPNYVNVPTGDIRTTGIINEVGSVQTSSDPLGTDELLQFTITLTATGVGTVTFVGDPADITPFNDTLLFDPPDVVGISKIRYGFDTLNIVAAGGNGGGEGLQNPSNPFDVNADGFVSPIDALSVINRLNSGNRSGGEGEAAAKKLYVDVNGDGFITPMDALHVINYLNKAGARGEGESVEAGAPSDLSEVNNIVDQIAADVTDTWIKKNKR